MGVGSATASRVDQQGRLKRGFLRGRKSLENLIQSWSEQVSWSDVLLQNERQMSAYNYDLADVEVYARHFDDFEAEARRCIDAGLPLPAYDCVLKCSHSFNLLDARRAVAVTDRADYILRIRRLAQAVARAYLEVEEPEAVA